MYIYNQELILPRVGKIIKFNRVHYVETIHVINQIIPCALESIQES